MFIGTVSILIILCNLYCKRSKFIYKITFFWMWILMAGTYGIADEGIYISRYTSPQLWLSNTEYLYSFIMLFFNKLGMDFLAFKVMITFIQLMLINSTIWKYASYPNIVLAFYLLFPFPLHVAQMRSALATAIFVWGLRYIIEDRSRKISFLHITVSVNDVKYIIVILIASLIHTQSIGWLVILLAKKVNAKAVVLLTIIFNFAIFYVFNPEMILKVLNIFGANSRIAAYFSEAYQLSSARQFGPLIGVLFTAFSMISLCICMLISKKNTNNTNQIELLLKINIAVLFIVSVIIKYTSEVYRIQEGLAVVNMIILTNAIDRKSFKLEKISLNNLMLYSVLIVYSIGIFGIRLLRFLIPSVLLPILHNNRFL